MTLDAVPVALIRREAGTATSRAKWLHFATEPGVPGPVVLEVAQAAGNDSGRYPDHASDHCGLAGGGLDRELLSVILGDQDCGGIGVGGDLLTVVIVGQVQVGDYSALRVQDEVGGFVVEREPEDVVELVPAGQQDECLCWDGFDCGLLIRRFRIRGFAALLRAQLRRFQWAPAARKPGPGP